MSCERVIIRRVEVTDLSKVETVARATWPVAYAGIIPGSPAPVARQLVLTGEFESRSRGARIEPLRSRIEWRCDWLRAVRAPIGTVLPLHRNLPAQLGDAPWTDLRSDRRLRRGGRAGPGRDGATDLRPIGLGDRTSPGTFVSSRSIQLAWGAVFGISSPRDNEQPIRGCYATQTVG